MQKDHNEILSLLNEINDLSEKAKEILFIIHKNQCTYVSCPLEKELKSLKMQIEKYESYDKCRNIPHYDYYRTKTIRMLEHLGENELLTAVKYIFMNAHKIPHDK